MGCFYPLQATQLPGGEIIVHKRTPGIPIKPTPAGYGRDIKLPCGRCIGCRMQTTQQWATRCLHESQLHSQNCFLTLTYAPRNQDEEQELRPVSPTAKPVDEREIEDARPDHNRSRRPKGANIARVDSSRRKKSDILSQDPDRSTSCLTPEGGEGAGLSKKDHQKFMKRLRDKCGPLRFYMCGEYGEKFGRPHYHYLLFGFNFADRRYHKTSRSGEKLYRSATLEKLWPFGKAWIGDVTYESCAYVAAYVMKKITGPMAEEHYLRVDEAGNNYWLMPEFALMSRGGKGGRGIAAEWWDEFNSDVYTDDHVIRNAVKCKPPRYYDKLLALCDPVRWEVIKFQRELRARELTSDNTPDRLAAKETVLKAKMQLKNRNLEKLK